MITIPAAIRSINDTHEMNMDNPMPTVQELSKCVRIPTGDVFMPADLHIPEECTCLVIFAFGSGRSRHNPRARQTARIMRLHGLGTLLCELLTEEEELEDEATEKFRYDVDLLANRLV